MRPLEIPVIDSVLVTFKVAELLATLKIKLGLSHSRRYQGGLELGYALDEFEKLKRLF